MENISSSFNVDRYQETNDLLIVVYYIYIYIYIIKMYHKNNQSKIRYNIHKEQW